MIQIGISLPSLITAKRYIAHFSFLPTPSQEKSRVLSSAWTIQFNVRNLFRGICAENSK